MAEFWHQVIKINNYQKKRFAYKTIQELNGNVKNKKIGILGWAFKKDTNDSRESASIYISNDLLNEGANLFIYDPRVSKERIIEDLKSLFIINGESDNEISKKLNSVKIVSDYNLCFENASGVSILTEWDEFKDYKWEKLINNMEKQHVIIDGRNL